MSEEKKPETGSITWFDLTVEHAEAVGHFYSEVVGWKAEPVPMGEYNDFNMNMPDNGGTAAGICHARGGNAGIPPQWMIYITVENVEKSAALFEPLTS